MGFVDYWDLPKDLRDMVYLRELSYVLRTRGYKIVKARIYAMLFSISGGYTEDGQNSEDYLDSLDTSICMED